MEWRDNILPPSTTHPLPPSYLNIDVVTAVVTVLDTVAMVTIGIIGIYTVMKFWQEHRWWQPHHEVPCDRPDCPHNHSHTTKEG